MFLPTCYDDLEAEYWKLLRDVTVWDVSVERQVEITGPDAFTFTNMLTPRDLGKCQVGQGKYVIITAADGGIINDPVLLRLGENHFWLAVADSDVLLWAKGVALNSGLDVKIDEPDVSPMQVQGPKSKQVVAELFGGAVLNLGYYHFLETELDGIPVVVTRTGWTGEVGYEIYLRDGSRGTELWDRVLEAGRAFDIAATGPSDIRRIEAGILNYGTDITLDTNPFEVGLDWQVNLDQEADFIGRGALERIAFEGPRRWLVGVEIDGEPLDASERDRGGIRDVSDLLSAAREEHRLRHAPDRTRGVGHPAHDNGGRRRRAPGDRRAQAVRRSAKGDPEVVGATICRRPRSRCTI
jgi:aminomethyltransferase